MRTRDALGVGFGVGLGLMLIGLAPILFAVVGEILAFPWYGQVFVAGLCLATACYVIAINLDDPK